MNTKEILTIIALAALGLCLLCSLAKMAMKKGDKGKKHCDKVCGAFVFLAIVLLAVSQLMGEGTEKYESGPSSSSSSSPCRCTGNLTGQYCCNGDADCPGSYCMNGPGKTLLIDDKGVPVANSFSCHGGECSPPSVGPDKCQCKEPCPQYKKPHKKGSPPTPSSDQFLCLNGSKTECCES